MKHLPAEAWRRAADSAGFVLPMTIVVLVILAAMGVTMISMSRDETLAARAMRESSVALYAAEAGGQQIYAGWDALAASVDALAPGDSLDLGWQTLAGGASYRGVVQRLDNGGQPMFVLRVEGRGPGPLGGRRTLSYSLTSPPGRAGTGYKLGGCCEAPVVLKGTFRQDGMDGGRVTHSGYDAYPPGWYDAGVCADTLIDKPGLIMQDTAGIELDPVNGVLVGVPPIVQDPQLNDSLFDYFGEHTWQDIKDKADIVIDTTGWVYMADGSNPYRVDTSLPDVGIEATEVYPRYKTDPETGELVCDTNHPLNWGSPDPNDPCFDYFPVILSRGEVDLRGGPSYGGGEFYGQGVVILDFDEVARRGSEFELEHDSEFRGIVLGKGCVEVQYGARFYGSMYLDATYDGVTCDKSHDFYEDCQGLDNCFHTTLQWSQCAVDRAIFNSGLEEYAEPEIPASGRAQLLGSRAFLEGVQ
ncbi:MAG: pilus assembly PilX N-terminal domain-containing protein [Gemmatimonadales bacterium]|jgi:hypothetical protein